jgi:dTMP kinase
MDVKFIVIEGLNGSGKSTQALLLSAHLQKLGKLHELVREPGGGELGEKLRDILKFMKTDVDLYTQTALFTASRCNLAHTTIIPALGAGKIVITDRWVSSTLVYQSLANSAGPSSSDILSVTDVFLQGLRPCLTIILDVDPVQAMERRQKMVGDRIDRWEGKGLGFQKRLRSSYLTLAETLPNHYVVDGNGSIQSIHDQIVSLVETYVPEKVDTLCLEDLD